MPSKRREFGWIRKLPSGRWQASYLGPEGRRYQAETTFSTRTDADRWLAVVRSELIEERWQDPQLGRQLVGDFVMTWIEQRHGLRPRTSDLYLWLARKYIVPQLGAIELRNLHPPAVRRWRSDLQTGGVSNTVAAKAYRLLRAVLATAADDEVIVRNPCRIKGAGQENPAERPTLTVGQVFDLAGRVPPRYQAMILVTTFASLRFGEVTALRRRDIDLVDGTVTVRAAFVERCGQRPELSPPKSRAGLRTVHLPLQAVDVVRRHLETYVAPQLDAFVFTGTAGAVIRRGNFNKLIRWRQVVGEAGLDGLHFHDLRHTGNTLAARVPGTSTRDLMQRMGHDSLRAAMIYQHAALDAQKRVAAGLTTQITEHVSQPERSVTARGQHAHPSRRSRQEAQTSRAQQKRGV